MDRGLFNSGYTQGYEVRMSIIVNYNPDIKMAVINQVCPRTKQMLGVLEVHVGESTKTIAHKLCGSCGCCESIAGTSGRSYDFWSFTIWCAVRSVLDDNLLDSDFAESWSSWLLRQRELISVTFGLDELMNFSEMVKVLFKGLESQSGKASPSLTVVKSESSQSRAIALS